MWTYIYVLVQKKVESDIQNKMSEQNLALIVSLRS